MKGPHYIRDDDYDKREEREGEGEYELRPVVVALTRLAQWRIDRPNPINPCYGAIQCWIYESQPVGKISLVNQYKTRRRGS